MRKLFSGLLIGLLTIGSFAQEGIQFSTGTWAEIKAEAKAAKKDIFIDCYTVWCGPCKVLARDIFPQKEVGDYFNEHFINYKVDMEKGEGIELKKQFRVRAFPTLLWIDSDGELLHKVVGSMPAEKLLEEAKKAPEMSKQTDRMIRKYKRNRKSVEHVKAYLDYLVAGFDPMASEVAAEYLQLIPENRYMDDDIFPIIERYIKNPHGPTLSYLYTNQHLLSNKFGDEYPSGFFYRKYMGWAMDMSYATREGAPFNEEAFSKLSDLMLERNFAHTQHIIDQTQLKNLEIQKNWEEYIEKVTVLIGEPDSVDYFNSVGIYLRPILNSSCSDKDLLKRCLTFTEKSFTNNSDFELMQYAMMWNDKIKIYEKLDDKDALEQVKIEKAMIDTLLQKERDLALKSGKGIKAMGMMGATAAPKKAQKLK